jgi:hypothetical protein
MTYNKYGNKKIRLPDGTVYDSKKEYKRHMELMLLQRAGEIHDLKRQVKYELIPKQEGERAVCYVADFVYTDTRTGEEIVEDCKGFRTDVYKLKAKIFRYRYGKKILET